MNGVEAAASLFGPDEPASDPFAVLGQPRSSHEDLFPVTGASCNATSQHTNTINVENTAIPPPSQEYTQQGAENSSFTVGGYAEDLGGWYAESAYHVSERALDGMAPFLETALLFLTRTLGTQQSRFRSVMMQHPMNGILTHNRPTLELQPLP